ncbi:MAG TPA: DUF1585 domain-containing protein [Bdellovibrionales bacterium]|nr:DUF1585 domain-containing protein [Bdellovibrionales bacterium]
MTTIRPLLKSKRANVLLVALTAVILCFQNCALKGMQATVASNGDLSNEPANYKPTNLTKAVMSAAKTFVNRLPTSAELEQAATGADGYQQVVASYLGNAQFRAAMFREHQNYLKLGGAQPPGAPTPVDYDQAARLGTHIVMTDQDYGNVLKAVFCVDANYQVQPFCDTFTSIAAANANAAGVLTTRAFISTHKDKKAFNFRLVNESFSKFNCAAYPDSGDANPMLHAQISSTVHPWGSTSQNCYGCHRTLNPKATTYYYYTRDGRFTANATGTTRTDANNPSTIGDLVLAAPRVNGMPVNNVRDLGRLLADDQRFDFCMTKRYVNFMLGKEYDAELPDGLTYLATSFRESGRNVRRLLLSIATSAAYVNRGELFQMQAEPAVDNGEAE